MMKKYFPIFIDLSEKRIVVVGGGTIATRRIKTILPFTGQVCVIAKNASEEIREMAKQNLIRWIQEDYERGLILDADMVLACTDDKIVNGDIYSACKCLGIMVNDCSDLKKCDFFFPGIVEKDNIVVGVTASGVNHKEAREVREKIAEALWTQESS